MLAIPCQTAPLLYSELKDSKRALKAHDYQAYRRCIDYYVLEISP